MMMIVTIYRLINHIPQLGQVHGIRERNIRKWKRNEKAQSNCAKIVRHFFISQLRYIPVFRVCDTLPGFLKRNSSRVYGARTSAWGLDWQLRRIATDYADEFCEAGDTTKTIK